MRTPAEWTSSKWPNTRGSRAPGQHQHGIVELGLLKGLDDLAIFLFEESTPTPRKNLRPRRSSRSSTDRSAAHRRDMVAALVADRHGVDIGAVPFADLAAGKFGHGHDQIGASAQARNKKAVSGAKARRKIIGQRAHGGVVHDDDLVARDQRPEHAQIEQQPSAGVQRKLDLLPEVAGEKSGAAERDILERKIARLGAAPGFRCGPCSAR